MLNNDRDVNNASVPVRDSLPEKNQYISQSSILSLNDRIRSKQYKSMRDTINNNLQIDNNIKGLNSKLSIPKNIDMSIDCVVNNNNKIDEILETSKNFANNKERFFFDRTFTQISELVKETISYQKHYQKLAAQLGNFVKEIRTYVRNKINKPIQNNAKDSCYWVDNSTIPTSKLVELYKEISPVAFSKAQTITEKRPNLEKSLDLDEMNKKVIFEKLTQPIVWDNRKGKNLDQRRKSTNDLDKVPKVNKSLEKSITIKNNKQLDLNRRKSQIYTTIITQKHTSDSKERQKIKQHLGDKYKQENVFIFKKSNRSSGTFQSQRNIKLDTIERDKGVVNSIKRSPGNRSYGLLNINNKAI